MGQQACPSLGPWGTLSELWRTGLINEALVESMGITDLACIWNIDEHGSEDMHKVKKVVGIKGIKQFQVQPREKARCTTMLNLYKWGWFYLSPYGHT